MSDNHKSQDVNNVEELKENIDSTDIKVTDDKKDNEGFDIPFIDPSVYSYSKKKNITKYVVAGVVGLALVVYFSGVLYFHLHFGTYTTINGYNVSGYTVDEVEKLIVNDMNAYEVTVRFKNGELKIKPGDGGLNINTSDSIEQVKKNDNPFLWFTNLSAKKNYDLFFMIDYDKEAMKEFISESTFMDEDNMKKSSNAEVVMDEGKVMIIPDVTGTELDKEKVYSTVFQTLDDGEIIVSLEESDCYIPAEITVDSEIIKKSAKSAEEFLAIEASYDFKGNIITIPKEDLCNMGYLSDDGTVKLSKTNIELYAKNFAEEYTTVYKERKFRTHDGELIYIKGEDNYGWELDPEQEAVELYEHMCTMKSFTKKPAAKKEGYTFWELNDIGNSYVEIDLSDQRVYVYIDGLRTYETPCVSGNLDYVHKTPGGLYGITYKANRVVLKGENYESPVMYWIPFNRDIGMHDATWRSEEQYTVDRYTWDGSHGCVNLPYGAAAKIYDLVEAGFPVVCYWEDEIKYVSDGE